MNENNINQRVYGNIIPVYQYVLGNKHVCINYLLNRPKCVRFIDSCVRACDGRQKVSLTPNA